jgi:hypothetical protein
MERVTSGTIEVTWDAESRLATIRFGGEVAITGRDAEILVKALTEWIGDDTRPFALLGDARGIQGVDAEYRAAWSRFFRVHRDRACVAFFNLTPVIRIIAEMFRVATGLQLKAFAEEAEARSWLREMGIAA